MRSGLQSGRRALAAVGPPEARTWEKQAAWGGPAEGTAGRVWAALGFASATWILEGGSGWMLGPDCRVRFPRAIEGVRDESRHRARETEGREANTERARERFGPLAPSWRRQDDHGNDPCPAQKHSQPGQARQTKDPDTQCLPRGWNPQPRLPLAGCLQENHFNCSDFHISIPLVREAGTGRKKTLK